MSFVGLLFDHAMFVLIPGSLYSMPVDCKAYNNDVDYS